MNRYHGSTMFCKECAANSDIFVDPSAGEIVCRTCGVVLGERCIDDGAEWRTFNTDDHAERSDPNRCGDVSSPLLSAASGMNTIIEGGRDKKQTARLQKAQGAAMKESASEIALKTDFYGRVRDLAHKLGLTQAMKEDACLLLRKAEDNGLLKTKKAERGQAMCVAVTYITCRVWRRSQTMKEMATISNVPLSALNKAFKKLCNNMEVDKGSVRAEHLIPQLCDKLGVPAFITVAAKHAAQQASQWDLVGGMRPSAVAAAAVLLVCSCWKPTACRDSLAGGSAGAKRKLSSLQLEGENEDEEELKLGPAAVSMAQEVTALAMKRPFRAMYEQRGRLLTAEFMERHAPKGVALESLKPALV